MQLDVIGYRYSREELAVLMSLQGTGRIPAVPGIGKPDRDQFVRGMSELEDNDILSNIGGQLLLDRIHSFLISNLCDCDRYFTVAQEKSFLALCDCPKIVMMVHTRDGEHWVVRVTPDMESLLEEYEQAAGRFTGSCTARMADGGEETESVLPDWQALEAGIREAITVLKRKKTLFD